MITPRESLHLGAAYYPEHWPEERWPEDIGLMQEASLSVVRMAEFAWSALEPSEGKFRFDWLHRAIGALAGAGIASVLGTPTAAPPAWLTAKHKEALAVDEYGRPAQHGNRCHYCVNSHDFRSGMKDDYNALLPMRQPGPLADVAGVEVEDYYALRDPAPVSGAWFTGSAQIWAERLRVKDAANTQIIARYGPSNGWLDGCPAVTVHAYEKGRVTFVGAYLDDASQRLLMERVVADAGVQPILKTPDGVEARCRITPSGQKVFIVINHERRDQSALLPWAAREHLSGSEVKGELMLEPYGVAVLTRLA